MKKTIIHVNQHNIKKNAKGCDLPVVTSKTYNSNDYGHGAILRDPATGDEVGRFRYEPDNPLSCGAKVWFETKDLIVEMIP
jgi:hypothetical protein